MNTASEVRWTVLKDYYANDINFTDTWIILYATEAEAEEAKTRLEAGQDTSWYDPEDGNDEQAFLYVDQIRV